MARTKEPSTAKSLVHMVKEQRKYPNPGLRDVAKRALSARTPEVPAAESPKAPPPKAAKRK